MRGFLVTVAVLGCLSVALSAPSQAHGGVRDVDNSIERELIRHNHVVGDDSPASFSSDESESEADSSPIASVVEEPDVEEDGYGNYDEEDLYDITVSDVIKDVLSTLQEHPDIVKELIESEKEKLAARLAEVDENEQEAELDDLADFQRPPGQLSLAPKAVEKKAGRSRMSAHSDAAVVAKRQNEVIDKNYPRSDVSEESREFHEFLNWPKEGGEDDSIFADEKSNSRDSGDAGGDTQSDDSDPGDSELPEDYRYSNPYQIPYRLPFLNRFGPPLDTPYMKGPGVPMSAPGSLSESSQVWDSHSVSEDSDMEPAETPSEDTSDTDTTESESHSADTSDVTSDNNESELSRLLHQKTHTGREE